MKQTPLTRKTPLKSGKPLERKTALPRQSTSRSAIHQRQAAARALPKSKRRNTGPPPKVRRALAERSGGVCEIAQPGCTYGAGEFAHRKKTGAGGRHGEAKVLHDVLSNALHACWNCHHRVCHARPTEAYLAGWMLMEHLDPTVERVLYRGAWRWLDDSGAVLSVNPQLAEEANHA